MSPGALFADREVDTSNNNLDVIDHEERTYLAFRTAPYHFASDRTELVIASRPQEGGDWSIDGTIHLGTDLREPRFLSLHGRLFLYFAELGDRPTSFTPHRTLLVERIALDDQRTGWTVPEVARLPATFIPWRFVARAGVAYLSGYTGGEGIYGGDESLNVYVLTSSDGITWTRRGPSPVHVGGASETAIQFDSRGNLLAVLRNEAGDAGGFGSLVCSATLDDLVWRNCKRDRRKYSSPLLLAAGDRMYLVARHEAAGGGEFDRQLPFLWHGAKRLAYQAREWFVRQRCGVWEVNQDDLTIPAEPLLDLPSRGDTCFPSALDRGEGVFEIFNYTSDPTQPLDPPWVLGQLLPTQIYSIRLDLRASPAPH